MEPFFGQYRSVMPYLMADDDPPPLEERLQSPERPRALRRHHQVHPVRRLHHLVPVVLGAADLRRPGRDRQRPPLHLRLARRPRRRAARDPGRRGRRLALPHDLQLHRRLPARHQHHPRHPRGVRRDRGAAGLKLLIRADGAARGNPGPAVGRRGADRRFAARRRPIRTRRPSPSSRGHWASRPTTSPSTRPSSWRCAEARELGADEVELVLDSKLIVEQLSGRWKIKHAGHRAAGHPGPGRAAPVAPLVDPPRAAREQPAGRRPGQPGPRRSDGGRRSRGRRRNRPARARNVCLVRFRRRGTADGGGRRAAVPRVHRLATWRPWAEMARRASIRYPSH